MENKSWKIIALKSALFGAGFALILMLVVGGFIWYQTVPKPPKPWDNNAIIATYNYVDTRGENDIIVFYYTLENNTDYDYSMKGKNNILLYANLERENNLSGGQLGGKTNKLLTINYPINIPSRHRVRFGIILNCSSELKPPPSGSSIEKNQKYRKDLAAYITRAFTNLNGFTIFDLAKRYEIKFKAGWKAKK